MDELSPEIADEDVIARAIKTPVHVDRKRGTVKTGAYMPPIGMSIISATRLPGVAEAKKAILAADAARPNRDVTIRYYGFSAIYAGSIRANGSTVYDAPDDYYGHAHIDHGVAVPERGEPKDSATNLVLIPKLEAMAKAAKAYVDPNPDEDGWSGESILPP